MVNGIVSRGDVDRIDEGIAQSREPIFPFRGANKDNHAWRTVVSASEDWQKD